VEEEVRKRRRRRRSGFFVRIGRSRWRQKIKRSKRRRRRELWFFLAGLAVVVLTWIGWAMFLAYPHRITLRDVPDTGIPEVVFDPEKAPKPPSTDDILPPKDETRASAPPAASGTPVLTFPEEAPSP
jgi:hypothetical protein